jgi:hypothetical protein
MDCAIEGEWASAFERGMVVGARHTGFRVSRTVTLQGFSHSTVSCLYQEWSTTQKTYSQLDTTALESTWASIPGECFRHLVESMHRRIEAVSREKGGASQY